MTALLDTDVLIDCLRGTSSARAWLGEASLEAFQVPGVVAMELVVGCQNRVELERTRKFLNTFDLVWPEASEFAQAYQLQMAHRLTSGLSIPDCLIATMTLTRSLFTHST